MYKTALPAPNLPARYQPISLPKISYFANKQKIDYKTLLEDEILLIA